MNYIYLESPEENPVGVNTSSPPYSAMLLIFALYLFQASIRASPIATTILRDTAPADPPSLADCICPAEQRTIWNIVWSCLVTIFACSWVSVHPNMPAPDENQWSVLWRRVGSMFVAIIAPEMVIIWAGRQWLAARRISRKYHAHGWTKTHGYFIQMGGFTLIGRETCEGELSGENIDQCQSISGIPRSKGILFEDRMYELLQEGMIQFPTITEKEIRDRSKGDGLSKALVIGQTVWFVTQCTARRSQGLIITELELVTAALAVLNGVMYFLWWNKPLDVQCSVPVYLFDAPLSKEQRFKMRPLKVCKGLWGGRILNTFRLGVHPEFFKTTIHYLQNIREVLTPTKVGVLEALKTIFVSPWSAVWYMIFDDKSIKDNLPRVHTFYAGTVEDEDGRLIIFGFFTAMIFGAIHCAAWARNSFSFPSHAEFLLWCFCSVAITTIPSFLLLAVLFHEISQTSSGVWVTMDGFLIIFGILTVFTLPVYIIARIVLLVEAVITLRDLPAGALKAVTWVTSLPHV